MGPDVDGVFRAFGRISAVEMLSNLIFRTSLHIKSFPSQITGAYQNSKGLILKHKNSELHVIYMTSFHRQDLGYLLYIKIKVVR